MKYGVKPINDVLTKQVRDYNVKKYDHFFEYNQAQDELEEQQKEVERVVKQEVHTDGCFQGGGLLTRYMYILFIDPGILQA